MLCTKGTGSAVPKRVEMDEGFKARVRTQKRTVERKQARRACPELAEGAGTKRQPSPEGLGHKSKDDGAPEARHWRVNGVPRRRRSEDMGKSSQPFQAGTTFGPGPPGLLLFGDSFFVLMNALNPALFKEVGRDTKRPIRSRMQDAGRSTGRTPPAAWRVVC